MEFGFQGFGQSEEVVHTDASDGAVMSVTCSLPCCVDRCLKGRPRIQTFQEPQPGLIHEFGFPPCGRGRLAEGEDNGTQTGE